MVSAVLGLLSCRKIFDVNVVELMVVLGDGIVIFVHLLHGI